MDVSKGDLLAVIDLMAAVAETSDSLEVDEAITTMELLRQVHSAVRTAEGMLDAAVKRHLEAGARQVGSRVYATKPDGKWRTYHDEIATKVIGVSTVDADTGEIRDAKTAAATAVAFMQQLYVAPAVVPKAGGLKALGLDKADVSKWERTGTKIEIIDMEAPDG